MKKKNLNNNNMAKKNIAQVEPQKNNNSIEKIVPSSKTNMSFYEYINRPKSKEEQERDEELHNKYIAEKAIIDDYNFKADIIALFKSCGWLIDKYEGSNGIYFTRYHKWTYDCPRAYFNKLTRSISFIDPSNKYGGSALITPFELYKILMFKSDKLLAVESLRSEKEINRKK